MAEGPVTWQEFHRYIERKQKDGDSSVAHLPSSNEEFAIWWRTIEVSDSLCERWLMRIRNPERFTAETLADLTALKRAA